MRRLIGAAIPILLLLIAVSRTVAPLPAFADPLPKETMDLLEKSLSIVEIDREIGRISGMRQQTQTKIGESERQLARQEIAIAVQREKAGKVLRAYYMGQKDFVLAAVLNANSLPELFRTWEMMNLIISSDRKALNQFNEQYESLQEGYRSLQRDRNELADVENSLRAQRERLLALQKEIDRALASSGDEAHLRELMAEMDAYWKNVGLFEVKRHFRALANAMQQLPDWIQDHPETMKTKGLKATLTLTDADLNAFLRDQNDAFKQFSIRFEENRMLLSGDNGGLQVVIGGHYSLQEEPENAIVFHVDSLTFNGLNLPDTTRADLEREFDLGFYPQKLVKFVKAQRVAIETGKLIVELKVG